MVSASMPVDGSSSCIRNVRPPVVSFSPSIWGDYFTNFSLDHLEQEKYAEAIEILKKDVRSMIMAATSGKLIKLIEIIERSGLGYHFEQTDIKAKLENILNDEDDDNYDLFTTALRFRLLRQHQYQVSCSVFEKFTDEENKFKQSVSSDAEGLLSLYEAAHIRIHGEHILEEAVSFTTHHLKRLLAMRLIDQSPLQEQVMRALEHPYHRGVPIIEIRAFISVYEKDECRDELLLKLAKLNFNFLQNLYRQEICELSRWWNKFELKSKLTYARDRMIECYFWGTAFHFEPQYYYVRTIVAKTMQMATIMDDTYDNYATLEEAQLFTDILERWDMDEIDRLPDYMKTVYQFIMSIYEDYERDAAKHEKSFVVPYFKETVKQLGRAYNQEQIWIMERQMPPFEEYMKNSVITSCIYLFLTALIPGLKSSTKETIDWLMSEPKIVISTAKMGRHLEDLGSEERENREGKLLTVADCYMKEHIGVSRKETLSKFRDLIEDAWKDVNKEWVMKTSIPKEMVEQLLNFGRMAEVTYKNSTDGYTYPEKFLAPKIAAIFVDPIVI